MAHTQETNAVSKVLYSESVVFPRRFVIVTVILETLIYLFIIASRFIDGLKQIHIPISFIGVSLIYLIFLIFTLLLLFVKVKTTVEKEGVRYRMLPVERKGHLIPKTEIEKYFIKNVSKRKSGKKDNNVLFLRLTSGKKVVLQTRRPKKLIQAVHAMMEREGVRM